MKTNCFKNSLQTLQCKGWNRLFAQVWLTEVGNDGHKIDGVHNVFDEFQFGRTGYKSSNQFEREPEDTDALHEKERFGYFGHFVFDNDRPIFDPVNFVVLKPVEKRIDRSISEEGRRIELAEWKGGSNWEQLNARVFVRLQTLIVKAYEARYMNPWTRRFASLSGLEEERWKKRGGQKEVDEIKQNEQQLRTYRGNVSKQKMSILMMITRTDMIATYRAAVEDSGCSNSSQICRCQYLVGSGLAVSSWPNPVGLKIEKVRNRNVDGFSRLLPVNKKTRSYLHPSSVS